MNIINTIAIQGIKGSFHHSVAEQYFDGKPSLLECMTFDVLVDSVLDQTSDVAVMAIENSIVGSIIPNYALIDTHNLSIIGEYYLDIQHNLMVLSGQNIQDITEVHSHPMALLQCKEFFKTISKHIKLVEAKLILRRLPNRYLQNKQLKGDSCNCSSKTAAEIVSV